jgi:hypothetical protein
VRRIYHWAPLVPGLIFLLFLGYLQRERALKAQNDFTAFYVGAKLAGSPDLYSRSANLEAVKSLHGFTMETVVYIRPPFYAALLKPLILFPFRTAYLLFSLATLGCILWFVLKFSRSCPALPFFSSFSIPFLASLCGGQDTPFLLALVGGSVLLSRREKDFAAGLLLSLCAIKFHLFVFVPVMLILKKRWSMVGGGALGTAILTALGIAVAGPGALLEYANVLRDPWINASAIIMPNLHGLVASLNGDTSMELILVSAVCALFLWITLRTDNYELLLAVALVCGLLVSFHSAIFDDVLLFVVFVLITSATDNKLLIAASSLVLTPLFYMMLLSEASYGAALPACLLLLLLMAAFSIGGMPLSRFAIPYLSTQSNSASERRT